MTAERFEEIAAGYSRLRIAVVGDFCLDRYLEIDPERAELSIETGLPVHNVANVRSQPGAAGTILANLSALGIGELHPIGFAGDDGEGHELRRALSALRGVKTEHFLTTTERRTFTYTKPLVCARGSAPVELSRLDMKNWSPTSPEVGHHLASTVRALSACVDAFVVMDQVPVAGTGVVTAEVREALREIAAARPELTILADSRRTLRDFPPVIWKMNAAELRFLADSEDVQENIAARALADRHGRAVFVTLAERGIIGAAPRSAVEGVPAFPVRGAIDIVGAGDAVTANLAAGLAAGATLREAMELAMAAASVVIHQLGTTGTASTAQIRDILLGASGTSDR